MITHPPYGKPKILIVAEQKFAEGQWKLNSEHLCSFYKSALEKLGAEPSFISYDSSPDSIELADGLLIPGGRDIEPTFYGREKHPQCDPSPWSANRVDIERKIWAKLPARMPVLAICYGLQLLNILHGGDLVQHIEDHKDHDDKEVDIFVESNSLVHNIVNTKTFKGKCAHHQCINKLGKGLKITGWDQKGIPHAIEAVDSERWMIGLQWHPERSSTLENELIIKEFVSKSIEYGAFAGKLCDEKAATAIKSISCSG